MKKVIDYMIVVEENIEKLEDLVKGDKNRDSDHLSFIQKNKSLQRVAYNRL